MRSHEHAIQQLNDVYLGFVKSLEPPLDQLALDPATFSRPQRTGGEKPFDRLEDLSLLDISLPFMLSEVFSLSQDELLTVAASAVFGLFAISLYDAMFDQQLPSDPDRMLLQTLLYTKSLSYLHALFKEDSPFWYHFRVHLKEYNQAISVEKERHCGRFSAYDKKELYEIARGKSAPRKIPLAAMAFRDGEDVTERIKALSASLDACAVANQILDDISDWQEDFSDRRFSYFLTRVIASRGLESMIDTEASPSSLEMTVHVFGSGELQILLDEAHERFEEAICHVEQLECPEWKRYLRSRAKVCAERKRRIETLIAAVTHWLGRR